MKRVRVSQEHRANADQEKVTSSTVAGRKDPRWVKPEMGGESSASEELTSDGLELSKMNEVEMQGPRPSGVGDFRRGQ